MKELLILLVICFIFIFGVATGALEQTVHFENKILNHEPITIGKSVSICKEQVVEYKDKQ